MSTARKLAHVSTAEDLEQRERVIEWLRTASPHDLLPPRRRDATPSSTDAEPLDVLSLGPGIALGVLASGDRLMVVPVAMDGGGPRRALAGDGVSRSILRAMRAGSALGAFRGAALAGEIDLRGDAEVAIEVDQSNESVVVGGVAVVKVFPVTSPGPQPGLDLPVHLASVGFTAIPTPLGALRWTSPAGEDVVLATAATFLPGASDGWEWYLARLLGWLDGDVDDATSFGPAPELGRLSARMHAALATPSRSMPHPTQRADGSLAERWRREALAVVDEALELTDGDEGSRLAVRAGSIRAELQRLGDADGVVTTRVHGDFHVGQVLEWDRGFAVADFDGNPLAPPRVRGAPDTPVRDVAAFVRSIDHLGRVASRRRPGRDEAIEIWIGASRARFLDAYREELAAAGADELFAERLLRPLEIAQECHEYVYAARFIPRWRYVPDLAIQALFPPDAAGADAAG